MKSKNSINAAEWIKKLIPYTSVYEEEGMIQTEPGTYSKMYIVNDVDPQNVGMYKPEIVYDAYGRLLNELPADMTVQFTIHNKLVQKDSFLKKVLLVPDKEEQVNSYIEQYNNLVVENSTIGHNNVKKNKYFTISVKASNPDEAVNRFRRADSKIKSLFKDIYGIEVNGLSITSRLKVMYAMYNPKRNDFGKKADIRGNGEFSLKDMKKLKLTTKDCIAPSTLKINKDHMILNGDTYAKALFISSLPAAISNNLFSDITNISSSMVFSVTYEPIDSAYGFQVVKEKVMENTVVKKQAKRDTIADRRNKRVVSTESLVNENEDAYFSQEAFKVMQDAVAAKEKVLACSFVIVLYADDPDALERDTKLLYISAAKFGCQVKGLDLQQANGIASVLPLANCKVDVKRVFNIPKIAVAPPFGINEVIEKNGMYYGLNALNDNLVLLNRKNNPIPAGLISGSEHCGKSFQCKREIFNALAGTDDVVFVISGSAEYDDFVKRLGGTVVGFPQTNPFEMADHYGFLEADLYSKSLMLEALFADGMGTDEDEVTMLESDVQILCQSAEHFNDPQYMKGLSGELKLKLYESDIQNPSPLPASRLCSYWAQNSKDLILILDYIWNKQIELKKQNRSSWVFIDSVDVLFQTDQGAAFIMDYAKKMNALQNVFTAVAQSSVRMFTDSGVSYRYEDFLQVLGYFKLLNHGPIERRKYMDILNIPGSLVNFMAGAELGRGIILTQSANYSVDDVLKLDDDADTTFEELFAKPKA